MLFVILLLIFCFVLSDVVYYLLLVCDMLLTCFCQFVNIFFMCLSYGYEMFVAYF